MKFPSIVLASRGNLLHGGNWNPLSFRALPSLDPDRGLIFPPQFSYLIHRTGQAEFIFFIWILYYQVCTFVYYTFHKQGKSWFKLVWFKNYIGFVYLKVYYYPRYILISKTYINPSFYWFYRHLNPKKCLFLDHFDVTF